MSEYLKPLLNTLLLSLLFLIVAPHTLYSQQVEVDSSSLVTEVDARTKATIADLDAVEVSTNHLVLTMSKTPNLWVMPRWEDKLKEESDSVNTDSLQVVPCPFETSGVELDSIPELFE